MYAAKYVMCLPCVMRLNIASALSDFCEYGAVANDNDDAWHYKSKGHQELLWRIAVFIPNNC